MTTSKSDRGFSLVEMVIAVFLLGLLAMATLPLLIGITKGTSFNTNLNSATGYANALIAELRAQYPELNTKSCSETLESAKTQALAAVTAPPDLAPAIISASCPSGSYPQAVDLTVSVKSQHDGATTRLATQIFVGQP